MDELCELEMADVGRRWSESGNPNMGSFQGPYGVTVNTHPKKQQKLFPAGTRYTETLRACKARFADPELAQQCADDTHAIENAIWNDEITEKEAQDIPRTEFVPGSSSGAYFEEAKPGERLEDFVGKEWYEEQIRPMITDELRKSGQLPPSPQPVPIINWMPWAAAAGIGLIALVAVAGRR
jgi:hypothetical protein